MSVPAARTSGMPRAVALLVLALAALCVGATPALAQGPRWQLSTWATPTDLAPEGTGKIVILAWNLGDSKPEGESAVTITDKLPPGLTATAIGGATNLGGIPLSANNEPMKCSLSPIPTCSWSKARALLGEALTPDGLLEVQITVKVNNAPGTLTNEARVEGGEAPSASATTPLTVNATPAPFGIERYEFRPENEDGSLDTQAGSHPFALTTTLGLNTTYEAGVVKAEALPKDLHVSLPAGLIGNPQAVPQCTMAQFTTKISQGNLCPADTAVGVAAATIREPNGIAGAGRQEPTTRPEPVFNLTPAPGEPARLGFIGVVIPIVLDTSVRTGGDYGVTVNSENILETAELLSTRITVWGVPGDPRHNASRGWGCLSPFVGLREPCTPPEGSPAPFLTLPTSCETPLRSTAAGDSWSAPGKAAEIAEPVSYTLSDDLGQPLAPSGCSQLPFSPSLSVAPQTQAGSTPTGLDVHLNIPQGTTLAANGLAEADVKDTTVALPEGMQVSPSSANGLEACTEPEVGFQSTDATGTNLFSPSVPEPFCANASKVGTVHIKTPLLSHELDGGVYLAAQSANPFGSLLALYIVAQDPVSGVLVKLAGEVQLDPHSGQIVSTFKSTPQLPFEDLKLEFFGGARGPVSTPALCGVYETRASLTPWSGSPPVQSASSFPITSGPNGSTCANPQPFSPSLSAGSTNPEASAFTPFTATFSREDGNQNLATIQLHLPVGLLGLLSSVTPCQEPQAALGTCGPRSLLGHTVATVGLGGDPYTVSGGQVYITGPYKGAPYGLSVAEPAKAGPFDLGTGPCDCVVVRAKIEVDRHTSALTVATDPLPTILQGIPLQLKHVSATVDRSGFTFNPTNCSQFSITASLSGEQGATAQASVPFRVANCATLTFKPKFTVLTQAKTSKASGASLHVKVTSGAGQANIGKVAVDLPKQLPSRLTTLQKACVDSVFDANPAACPAASLVGTATAVTPVLKNPLSGPAYLVSHGGVAFPDLVVVLQGEGITLYLDGNTRIKNGITRSTFNSLPDAPIDGFDLMLPQGPHSVLATDLPARAKASMCGQRLTMPTTITGQNGAVLRQTTRIAVSGCPKRKAKRAKKAKRAAARRGRSGKRRR